MESRDITSSVIASAGYDDDRNLLQLTFHSGRVYNYYHVPRNVYEGLLAAESAGKYLNELIRKNYENELVYDPRRPRVIRRRE
jgi:KTSC domain